MAKLTSQPSALGRPGRHLKSRLAAGEVLIGASLTEYVRPSIVKLFKYAGYDFIYLEYEHPFLNGADVVDTVLSARDNGLPVIAKTPQLERGEVAKLLECGVVGIQLPRTESRAQLEELISYMKFPPLGTRAGAPGYGNTDYAAPADAAAWLREADQETTVVVHIETRKGYENAEEIVSTPHVDMVYVGPYDFSISMGRPGDYDHPDVVGPMEEIARLCRKHGVPFGTSASGPAAARRWIERGCRFFETADELTLLSQASAALVREYRSLISTAH